MKNRRPRPRCSNRFTNSQSAWNGRTGRFRRTQPASQVTTGGRSAVRMRCVVSILQAPGPTSRPASTLSLIVTNGRRVDDRPLWGPSCRSLVWFQDIEDRGYAGFATRVHPADDCVPVGLIEVGLRKSLPHDMAARIVANVGAAPCDSAPHLARATGWPNASGRPARRARRSPQYSGRGGCGRSVRAGSRSGRRCRPSDCGRECQLKSGRPRPRRARVRAGCRWPAPDARQGRRARA